MKKINWYRFDFFQIAPDSLVDKIEKTIETMSRAVQESDEAIQRAEKTGDEQYLENVIDEETAFIETLLGIAFVLCQTYITFVVSHVKKLHDSCQENGINLTTTDGSKLAIVQLDSKFVLGTPYSEVQVIDAFANYFKHHDEWGGSWANLSKPSVYTVTVIQAVGASQFSNSNLRTASQSLGNPAFDNFRVFTEILRNWGLTVHAQYDAELQALGLL